MVLISLLEVHLISLFETRLFFPCVYARVCSFVRVCMSACLCGRVAVSTRSCIFACVRVWTHGDVRASVCLCV